VDISEAPLQGKDIYSYSPRSIGASDYRDLALEIDKKR
jgi:cellulose biosynthesis protein BcsQ